MLTDLKIQHLKTEQGRAKRYADRDGLVMEVRASGKKVFIAITCWLTFYESNLIFPK